MYIKFNSLNRHEPLQMTLCNPGSIYIEQNGAPTRAVCMLTDVTDEEMSLNFNPTSQLNFRVHRVPYESEEDTLRALAMYNAVQKRRHIFVTGVGYFMITEIVETYDADGNQVKDVVAESNEAELRNRKVPFIEDGTYRFLTNRIDKRQGLFDLLIAHMPLWTIGEIDPAVAARSRTFEDVDVNKTVLDFLLTDMQDAYECVFEFNTMYRTISVYDQASYVRPTNVHLTRDDVIQSLKISDPEDIYTAIAVHGDNNITIAAINPLGNNKIYNFNHYLDWMSDGLKNKVVQWQNAVRDNLQPYYDNSQSYFEHMETVHDLEAELQRIDIQETMYQRCRDNVVAESSVEQVAKYNKVIVENGGQPIDASAEIQQVLDSIDTSLRDCREKRNTTNTQLQQVKNEATALRTQMDKTHEALTLSNYFTSSEMEELSNYIFEGTYNDEYVTITESMTYEERFVQMKTLYDRASLVLQKSSQVTQEFQVDVDNFVFDRRFKAWSDQLCTGCLVNVEIEPMDVAQLFLTSMTVNYADSTLRMQFGNRLNKLDPKSLFDNVFGSVNKSANSIGYIKNVISPIKDGEFNSLQEAINSSRDITMGAALASADEDVVIDGAGYTGRKKTKGGSFDPRQVKIVSNAITFTDDAWKSSKIAIGELAVGNDETIYGVNAQTLIGNMIVGNNLKILNKDGKDLLSVMDDKIATEIGGVNDTLSQVVQDTDSLNVRISSLENKDDTVHEVTTTTGYRFGAEGLVIHRSGDEMVNKLDNTGMYITRSNNEGVLTANNTGVNAINLTARQYLIVGSNSRFENYVDAGEQRTACFYIGSERKK